MAKVLVDLDTGQTVVDIHETGRVLIDESKVIWDERSDGKLVLDDAMVGGYMTDKGSLVFDSGKKAINDAIVVAVEAEKEALEEKRDEKLATIELIADRLKSKDELTDAEVKNFLRKIMELYG